MIGMHPGPGRVGFGYVLAREHWNRGYMTEALKALVDWSLSQDGIHRAQAFCDLENPASARIMEKGRYDARGHPAPLQPASQPVGRAARLFHVRESAVSAPGHHERFSCAHAIRQ